MKVKHGLLAAVASIALIAGAGGVFAQGAGGGAGGGDTQVQGQGGAKGTQVPGGAQAPQGGAKPGATQTQTQGSGKTQTGQSGSDKMDSKPGQAQTQERDSQKRDSAGTDKPVQLDDQQRTKISASIRDQKGLKRVERTSINFNINVGTVVPRTIGLAPLPAPIYAVVPAYRGFLYIVVGDELLIVHPRTYEIVAVIPA
jgi:hypothetical protein